jgi:hypothetical protein
VLSETTADTDDDRGWWFRAPRDPAIGVKKLPKDYKQSTGIMPQLGSLIFAGRTRNVGHVSSDWVLPDEGEGDSILSPLATWERGSTSEESVRL